MNAPQAPKLFIFRPEPGASASAERARNAGWDVTVLPLFEVTARDWDAPEPDHFDAVLMTSANTARFAGPQLACFRDLPLYAVGAQTAKAAQDYGFETLITGASNAGEVADRLRQDGQARIFHPAGEATRPFDESGLSVTHVAVYAASRVPPVMLGEIMADTAIMMVHSPRSAHYLDELLTAQGVARTALSLVAISEAALERAGSGWHAAIAADLPSDDAMLAAAATLVDAQRATLPH